MDKNEEKAIFVDYYTAMKTVNPKDIDLTGCMTPQEACLWIFHAIEYSATGANWHKGILEDCEGHLFTVRDCVTGDRFKIGYIRTMIGN
jgi:hypothetical protein